ncbi:4538_t:CDS:2 [Cetraspora pellucida]|uniref:4538_t:CDS:1 n=1 Tax=Cetraspora pellucida TaxID=1433469 RepID=A0A9N9IBK8_9GLOM|nr:4538_t:CDS:2 [Cetraspora pellucida]
MDSNIKNIDLASKYQVGKSTITDILKKKECWLAITIEEEGKIKKFRRPKWPKIEEALGLWVDNVLNSGQDIDGHILKNKAKFFADHFLIDDFHYSDGWLTELIELDQDSDMDDESKLTELIGCLLTDDSLTAYEYIFAKNDEVKGRLTNEKILEIVESENKEESKEEKEEFIEQEKVSYTEAKLCVNKILRFLYEQGPKFGDVDKE